jgi:antitoxin (DNA-binding transcriptional repressor) of toxin-antitoxin stability system
MRRVSETEALDRLHELLRAAAQGERISITSSDGAVAELGPADREQAEAEGAVDTIDHVDDKTLAERQRAKQRLVRHLRRRVPTGQPRDWTRDELYDDD